MTIDLTDLILAVLTIIFSLISSALIPWIREKMSLEEFNNLALWVRVGVEAAEQLYRESGKGAEKKAYVLKFLRDKGLTVNIDDVDNLIESAVYDMKNCL